jgi:hypothetical protein
MHDETHHRGNVRPASSQSAVLGSEGLIHGANQFMRALQMIVTTYGGFPRPRVSMTLVELVDSWC